MKLVMLGPPGSGKGTQAAKLAEEFGAKHVSTGEAFREIKKKETPLGRKVRELVDNGILVDDETTFQVVQDALKGVRKFVLDGYPRNVNQAELLETITGLDFVIELVVSDSEVVRRISSRRVCGECGASFNTIFLPPREPGKCDFCQSKLVQREDSRPEAVKERLRIYHKVTEPLSGYYREEGILVRINGEQPIQKVFDDIMKRISA